MNYYIFIVTDQSKYGKSRTGIDTYKFLMNKKVWGFGEHTKYRNQLKPGDYVVFYLAGIGNYKFLGTAKLSSAAHKGNIKTQAKLFLDPENTYMIDLEDINIFKEPKPIKALLDKLVIIKDKTKWGTYFQGGSRKITKKDWDLILKQKGDENYIMEDKNYWVVRMGRGGIYSQWAIDNNIIAVGWDAAGNILKGTKIDDAIKEYKKHDTEKLTDNQIKIGMNQLFKFVYDIKINDIVLVPDTLSRIIYVGEVMSNAFYEKDPKDNCGYQTRRKIKLLGKISRDDISTKFRYSIGALLTLFSVNSHKEEIQQLLKGIKVKKTTEKNETVTQRIISKLYDLDGQEFEQFITHLLNVLGLEAAITQYVGDKGVDVVGTLNAEGLANIILRVQAKRVKPVIGIEEVQRIRGTLGQDEHGVIITLSNFSKQAIEDSEDQSKKPIVLIDRETLIDIILEHFEELDKPYQDLLEIKPRKLSAEEKFTTI